MKYQIHNFEKRSKEAQDLYLFLEENAGHTIISGQHTQTLAQEEVTYIQKLTGFEPKLRGYELLAYSPNIVREGASEACLAEVDEDMGTLEDALQWAKETSGILTFTWHWFSPIGGHDKSFYAINTDFQPSRVLIDGSEEQKAFDHDARIMAEKLIVFRNNGIPILWRPFHESEGTWFWWGREGTDIAIQLFQRLHRIYDEYDLDNLLWVWNSSKGYPGDEYCDLISADYYLAKDENQTTDYANRFEELQNQVCDHRLIALGELGVLPDVDMLSISRVPWAYVMLWSKDFVLTEEFNSDEKLRAFYQNPYVMTL